MSEEVVFDVLEDLGIRKKESRIYTFLAKAGTQKANVISKSLGIHKVQVYRALDNLQNNGLVELTLERPRCFSAVAFEKLLDMLIERKRSEANSLREGRQKILSHWSSISVEIPKSASERFAVISGRQNIYTRLFQMINESKQEFLIATSNLGIVMADQAGIIEALRNRAIKFRILTEVSASNFGTIKSIINTISARSIRHLIEHQIELSPRIRPRFMIRDGDEAMFLLAQEEDNFAMSSECTGFWIKNNAFVYALKTLFEELWSDSISVDDKIQEIEIGKPHEETIILKDAYLAYSKFREVIDAARTEILMITSSRGIIRFLGSYLVKEYFERGVKIRLMATINKGNLEVAQKLSEYCEIRHTSIKYLRMTIVDKKHFFQFKIPSPSTETIEPTEYFDNMFYTNDLEYVKRMGDMLNEVWKNSSNI